MTEPHHFSVNRAIRWLGGVRQAPMERRRRNRPDVENLESRCLLSSIVDFPTPTTNSAPFAITSGPAGNVWFAETHVGKIGVINPTTDAISEFSLPTGASSADLLGITSGPDRNVWFTDGGNDAVGAINTTSHAITEYTVPTLDSFLSGSRAGLKVISGLRSRPPGKSAISTHEPRQITEYTVPTSGSLPALSPWGLTATFGLPRRA